MHMSMTQAKQGDVVIPLSGFHVGQRGLSVHHPETKSTEVYVGFNVSGSKVPGETGSVLCSGGPFTTVKRSELIHVGTTKQSFLDLRAIDGPNRYGKFEEQVNLWVYRPTEESSVCLGHSFGSYAQLLEHETNIAIELEKMLSECADLHPTKNPHTEGTIIIRGSHQVCSARHRFYEDRTGAVMFAAYQGNTRISLYKVKDPDARFMYQDNSFGVFVKNDSELDALLEAYGITDTTYDEETRMFSFEPNINVQTWKRLVSVAPCSSK
ncbi:hypothetical protein L1D14_26820 [Vibrio tubiashii]|uniref:hypothetical protein n=1 Tax=Vibrio tubiashii TaxID=29498 RepID=UPI001EFD8FF0|nr:hypothetical protein [Vibrio tubiashii]MCG9579819.1 hypothetical protein [Vibrio tubiashii]